MRYSIENASIDRFCEFRKCLPEGIIENGIYIVENSEYIKYFENQVSGTRPVDELKHYIFCDNIDTILDVLTEKKPTFVELPRNEMRSAPNPFELKAMRLALRDDADWIVGMRAQLPHLTVLERKSFGRGFTTNFYCAEVAAPVNIPLRDGFFPVLEYPPTVNAKRSVPTDGLASFKVWLDVNGRIEQLEACPLTDDQWPDDLFSGFHSFQDDEGNIIEDC
jgi:hypothetical protein